MSELTSVKSKNKSFHYFRFLIKYTIVKQHFPSVSHTSPQSCILFIMVLFGSQKEPHPPASRHRNGGQTGQTGGQNWPSKLKTVLGKGLKVVHHSLKGTLFQYM